jgi:SAM-dependent methyltransferase
MFDAYKDIFNRRGAAYDAAMRDFPHARDQEFQAILDVAQIRDGMNVLDMPSGGGYLDRYINQDIKLTCVETAEQFLGTPTTGSRVTKLLRELHDTKLPSASQDMIICLAGLHHVADKPGLFAEMFRLLKPGGALALADAYEGSRTATFLDGFLDAHNSSGHEGEYLSDTTRADLRKAGFTITRDQPRPYHWVFESSRHMAEFCRLLFGMDKATVEHVEVGIETEIGYQQINGKTCMNWELHFLRCEKKR